jgi:hypothetical protein
MVQRMHKRTRKISRGSDARGRNPASRMQGADLIQRENPSILGILSLQKAIGNRGVRRLFESGIIQAKLKIGQPGGVYEREADRVAEQVMRLPGPAFQRKPT